MQDAERLMDELNGITSPLLLVDSTAMVGVSEVARRLLSASTTQVVRQEIIIRALHDYMLERGLKPNFEVVV
jgi:hypothetical protein